MSDAGEPHGTAGRPMLTALLHSGVGDVAAVVTRWYGGTKLGTGGLARAYAGGVVSALATLPTAERVTWARLRLTFGYDVVTAVQQLAAAHGARVADEAYAADVTYAVDVPASSADALAAAVRDATRGRAAVERDDA
jgi:putative IMPACT (imprinted ancient) family translation regulator